MKRSWFDVFVMILMYLGIVMILVWAVLKAFGVINSPVWVEMVPYVGIGLSLGGVAYRLGKIVSNVEYSNRKISSLMRMRDDFVEVRNNQKMCLGGKLSGSPYEKFK